MNTPAKTDQSAVNRLRHRNSRYFTLILFMTVCSLSYYAETTWLDLEINRSIIDFFSGMFSSLTLILTVAILLNYRVIKRETVNQ